jgi:hypothetical protein
MLAVLALGQSAIPAASSGSFAFPCFARSVATSPPALLANEFKRRLAHVEEDHRGIAGHGGRTERNGNDGESRTKKGGPKAAPSRFRQPRIGIWLRPISRLALCRKPRRISSQGRTPSMQRNRPPCRRSPARSAPPTISWVPRDFRPNNISRDFGGLRRGEGSFPRRD